MTTKTTPPRKGVSYRVLPKGAGQVFTGQHTQDEETGQIVFTTYDKGETVENVDPKIAAELEERGWVEVLG